MKNSQKGFIVPFLIVIIAILAMGGVYIYSQNKQSVQVNSSPQTTAPVQTATDAQTLSAPPERDVQFCGEVISTFSSDAAQQKKNNEAYACMSSAMVACSPARIVVPFSTSKETFEILKKGSNYCVVSQTIDSPASKMTCDIPSDFISATDQFLKTKKQSSMLFYSIPLFFVPTPTSVKPMPALKATVKNPLTGQAVTAQCISN